MIISSLVTRVTGCFQLFISFNFSEVVNETCATHAQAETVKQSAVQILLPRCSKVYDVYVLQDEEIHRNRLGRRCIGWYKCKHKL